MSHAGTNRLPLARPARLRRGAGGGPGVAGLLLPGLVVVVGAGLAAAASWATVPVLGGLAALGCLAFFGARPQWALILFVATIPLEYEFRLGASPSLTITKLAGGLCFAAFAIYAVRQRRPLFLDSSHLLIVGLLLLALASTALSQSVSEGTTTTLRYVSWALLYFVLTQFPGDRALLRRLVWALVLSSGAAGAIGSYNFLAGLTQLADLRYGQQNDYAFVLAAVLPIGAWLVLNQTGWRRIVALVSAGLIAAGIVLSVSRGAWLAVVASFVLYAAANRQHASRIVGLALVAAVVTSLFVYANPGRVSQGVQAKQVVAQENVDSRLALYQGALGLTVRHPLLGVGPGNFGNYYYQITGAPPGTPPLLVVHDTYLEVAAELGVPGFIFFMTFLAMCLLRLNGAVRSGAGPPGLAGFVRASFIAVLVGFLTLSEEFFAPVWLLGGLATILWVESCESST
ncbi:MAG TPA: O-antigen ligase family protein [Mycobacteriales bacterium]|nr:O-antigen ligase family protein [Mycobacteriales bacterium]